MKTQPGYGFSPLEKFILIAVMATFLFGLVVGIYTFFQCG